jgi:hypothetical protein
VRVRVRLGHVHRLAVLAGAAQVALALTHHQLASPGLGREQGRGGGARKEGRTVGTSDDGKCVRLD